MDNDDLRRPLDDDEIPVVPTVPQPIVPQPGTDDTNGGGPPTRP